MDDKVYVVTAGCYSDYHIDAVFKDKSKAEIYCSCHEDCEIEEYDFSDDNIFTPFESVIINFDIYKDKNREDRISFRFRHLAKEDAKWYMENRESVSVYDNDWISICLWRRLPNNYDENKIRNKYTKVYQDLRSEILYLVSEFDCSTYDKRRIVSENLQKYIEERFGIEKNIRMKDSFYQRK